MNNQLLIHDIKKLDGTNYKEWTFNVGLVLKQKLCWFITTGIEKKPHTIALAEWLSWSQKKEIAMSTIFLTMECQMQQRYMEFEDPHILWEKIKSDYTMKIKKNTFTIQKELYGICLEDSGSVEVYAQYIQHVIDHFNLTTEEDSEKMSNIEHLFFLLNGIVAASPDRSVTLQLLHDCIVSESLDTNAVDVLLNLIAREVELEKNKGISSHTLLYTKG